MKKTSLFFFLPLLSLLFITCSDKDEVEDLFLIPDVQSIVLESSDAQEKEIPLKTNLSLIDIDVPVKDQEWCSAKVVGDLLKVSITQNPSYEKERTTIITLSAQGITPQKIPVIQPARRAPGSGRITSFIVPAELNGLKTNLVGIISQSDRIITLSSSQWIENVKTLKVRFQASGKVYVDDVEQVSEVTPNSFMGDLVYTVKGEDGFAVTYDVKTVGPMFTGLPVISVDIEGGKEVVEKKTKLLATLFLTNPDDGSFDMSEVDMWIRGRGNSTWGMPKKPYRIDFPNKTSVFGLPKAKKWVLLANYQDPTLLMNDVAFELGRRFGLQYTHSSIHVELFVNGTYRGNYQLTEQKEIGEGRVDVDEKEGFLVEMDSYYDEDYKFKSAHLDLPVMVGGPDLGSEADMEYIRTAIQGLEDALFEADFPNTSYEKHTDVASLINFMLVNEVTRNQELHHPKSTYCYKDAHTKIMWGPLWDFDWGFGYNESNTYFVKSDLIFYKGHRDDRPGAKFFNRFMEVPEFRAQYKARWKEIRPQVVDVVNYIDKMAAKLNKSQVENFKLSQATPNTKNKSYQLLITDMKNWINSRIQFLDREFEKF